MSSLMGKKVRGDHGRIAEKRASKRLGGKLMPGSGSLEGAKGDFTVGSFLIENKSTTSDSLSLKLSWLLKISQEALEKSLNPALAVQFVGGDGRPMKNGSYVLISEQLFKEIMCQ